MQNFENSAIIFIHEGASFYLPYTLMQAHASNPENEIILIGDKAALKQAPKWVKKCQIADYAKTADQFTELYKNAHRSYNSFRFENGCFRRTFLLEEYCRKSGTERFWYFDSDVLLYGNLKEELQHFPEDCQWSSAGEEPLSPHSSFWDIRKLIGFNAFLLRTMTPGTDEFMKLKQDWEEYKTKHNTGGICDMSVFTMFSQQYPEHFYRTIRTPGGTWNSTLYTSFPEIQRNRPFYVPEKIRFADGFYYFYGEKC